MSLLSKYNQPGMAAQPKTRAIPTGGLQKYVQPGQVGGSTGGSDDWYSADKYPERMAYWSDKYKEQKPYIDKETGEARDTTSAKYYKEKMASDLMGSRQGLEHIAKTEGLKVPEEKKKLSVLNKLFSVLASLETGDVVYQQLKAKKEGKDFSNIEALKQYGKGIKKGIKGEGLEKKTYKDVFQLLDWKPESKAGKAGQWLAGTAADILLDPTTYLTGGVGAGRSIAVGGGKKILSKQGMNLFKKATKQFGDEKTAERMISNAIQRSPEKYDKLIKKGGIKFMGKSIIPERYTKKLAQMTGATKAKEAIRKSRPAQALAHMFKRDVRGDAPKEQFELMKDMVQTHYHDRRGFTDKQILEKVQKLAGIKTGIKSFSRKGRVTPEESQAIYRALLERDITSFKGAPKELIKQGDQLTPDMISKATGDATSRTDMIQKEADILKGMEEGLTGGQLQRMGDKFTRTTEHSPMYREFYKTYGRAPKSAEDWADIAEKNISQGMGSVTKEALEKAPVQAGQDVMAKIATPTAKQVAEPETFKQIIKGYPKLDKKLEPAGKEITDMFTKMAKAEKLDKTRLNYVPQVYKDPRKSSRVLASYTGSGGPKTTTRFAKERQIDSIADIPGLVLGDKDIVKGEALDIIFGKKGTLKSGVTYDTARKKIKEMGLEPETDIFKTLAVRAKAHGDVMTSRSLYKKLGKQFGKDKAAVRFGEDYVQMESKHLGKDVRLPRFVADTLKELEKKSIDDKGINEILRGWNKVQNFYKLNLTTLFPAFHARNFVSNVAQTFLDIGLRALNPKEHLDGLRAMRGVAKGGIKTKTGTKYSFVELKKLMSRHGVTSTGFFEAEAGDLFKKKLGKGLSVGRLGGLATAPYKAGRKVGTFVENEARAMDFVANLKRGLSPEDAGRRTKQFLFDYDNLSEFEKKYMKSAIPFYTFSRKNIELQTSMLKEKPGMVGAELKAIRNVGEPISDEDREALPDFVQHQAGVKLGEDKYGRPRYISGFGLPTEEYAAKMSDPLKQWMGMISPMIKAPVEALTGKDIFREKDIKDLYKANEIKVIIDKLPENLQAKAAAFMDLNAVEKGVYVKGKKVDTRTEYRADPWKLWMIRNLPTSRIQGTLGQVTSDQETKGQKALKTLTGVRGYSFDEEEQKFFKESKVMDELQSILQKQGIMGQGATGVPYIKDQEKYLEPYLNKQKAPNKYGSFLARN